MEGFDLGLPPREPPEVDVGSAEGASAQSDGNTQAPPGHAHPPSPLESSAQIPVIRDSPQGQLDCAEEHSSRQDLPLGYEDAIDDKPEQTRRGVLGGQPGKRVIVYIDDVNMENAGTRDPFSILTGSADELTSARTAAHSFE